MGNYLEELIEKIDIEKKYLSLLEQLENEKCSEIKALGILREGYQSYKAGRLEEAIGHFDEAISLAPKSAVAYLLMGCANSRLKKYEEAIRYYSKTIKLGHCDAEVYFRRGDANYFLKYFHDAIKDYNEVLRIYPGCAEAYHMRGNANANVGTYWAAIEDYDKVIELESKNARAHFNKGCAIERLEKLGRTRCTAQAEYNLAIKTALESTDVLKKPVRKKVLETLQKLGRSKDIAKAFINRQDEFCLFLEKLSAVEDKILEEYSNDDSKTLMKYYACFGGKAEYSVFKEGEKQRIVPIYRLSKVKGRRIFGSIGAMLRDNNGDITAVPKVAKNGGRTCWLPEEGIELKGIGTIDGKPNGNYGQRNNTEDPDPIGGMIKDKAIYEYLANVYLYIAGVDVPEPLGVAVPYKIRGPNSQPLAVLARKPKTKIRASELDEKLLELAKYKVVQELRKMHYLGLVHSWLNYDNFNASGQILDLEGVRIAVEHNGFFETEKKLIHCNMISLKNGSFSFIEEAIKRADSFESSAIGFEVLEFNYHNCLQVIRLLPKELTDTFAALFTDENKPSEEAKKSMRDPRDIIGEYAKKHLDSPQKEVKGKARLLYSRYKKDLKETNKIASRFQKEIDYVKENFNP